MLFTQIWPVRAKKMKSLVPLHEDPRAPELERLLAEDPYEVSPQIKEGERKNRTKSLFIRGDAPGAMTGSDQSSLSESRARKKNTKNRMKGLVIQDNTSSVMSGITEVPSRSKKGRTGPRT